MGNFDSGVASYIKASTTVTVYFPVDKKGAADISCSQCDYFRRQSQSCALNGKICAYPTHYVGAWCPLELVENVEKENEE